MCLDRICKKFADSDALISRHQGFRYTYGQLKQEVENAARGLMWIGVEKGERVGVWSPNCAEWLIAQYALAKVGAIMVNINPAYQIRELEHALTQSGVSVIVAARGFRNSDYAAMIDTARWMHSGDLAVMRADGRVNIVGRLKDMIIRGGENIYPREIEEFLHTHPKVSEVQVIGVPDRKYGEEVCAWIRLRQGHDATEDEIRDFCRGQIATFNIPRYIRFVNEFPMTVTGKIQKFRMREQMLSELGLSVDQTA